MQEFKSLKSEKVFRFFGEICKIPHGSGNMEKIADYCADFAKTRGLRFTRDAADNVIIYKAGTNGSPTSEPVILQGHLDMVCQKTADSATDFLRDPIEIFTDGDFVKAKGTTLGADNGIAVAMVLAILDSDDLAHPPIEAVFTTDEEIGMIGASRLDMTLLSSKRMINLDSEEDDVLTVSCAGGEDLTLTAAPDTKTAEGTAVTLIIEGLRGGHSGVEIDKGRVNSNILAGRFLRELKNIAEFDIISVKGGDKSNAIPLRTEIVLSTGKGSALTEAAARTAEGIKAEISAREPDLTLLVREGEKASRTVFSDSFAEKVISALSLTPNGIVDMSREIEGLVETSLNLGILSADPRGLVMHYALRSNKTSALKDLVNRLSLFADLLGFSSATGGFYPPWEFKEDSSLQKLYREAYKEVNGDEVRVEAIHAGLECAVFASRIKGLDCIAIGPTLYDVHTTGERMKISSVEKIYKTLTKLLASLK